MLCLLFFASKVHVKKTNAPPAYLKINRFDTLKKQAWEETNKLSARSVLRSWEGTIWKPYEKHVDLSSEDPKQLCKDIKLSKDDTSMHKRKDTHSDGLNELPLSGDEIDEEELDKTLLYHDN